MKNKSTSSLTPQLVLAIAIISLGVLLTLDNLDILEARDYFRFWPTALMALGLAKVFQPQGSPGRISGFILTLFGTLLLLNNMHWLHFRVRDLWPLALILIGCSMLWQVLHRRRPALDDDHSTINGIAILSGYHRNNNSQDFRGGELTAIMGGCEVDLRQASIRENEEAVIDIFAIWGGIEIRVPEDWSVTLKGFPFMGGIEDSTHSPKDDVKKRLLVKGIVIMGGAEIKN